MTCSTNFPPVLVAVLSSAVTETRTWFERCSLGGSDRQVLTAGGSFL